MLARPSKLLSKQLGVASETPFADNPAQQEAGIGPHLSPSKTAAAGGALADGEQIDIYRLENIGFILQYFTVGIIYGGLPATVYGLFLGYLNVPAYVYATAGVITTLPWSFKFLFGMLNDCCPLLGYRRKPYMVIGWTMCCGMLIVLSTLPLPDPYFCINPLSGEYIKVQPDGKPARPCNCKAREEGGLYAMLMCLAALGYVVADVAADGLTVEYAQREPTSTRGTLQTTVYLVRTLGSVVSVSLIAFCMNGKQYNGSFTWTLSYDQICMILAIPAGFMIPISWWLIKEDKVSYDNSLPGDMGMNIDMGMGKSDSKSKRQIEDMFSRRISDGDGDGGGIELVLVPPSYLDSSATAEELEAATATATLTTAVSSTAASCAGINKVKTFREYRSITWKLLSNQAFFYVVMYQFLQPFIGGISTTAGGYVKQEWAGVKNLQNQLFSLLSLLLFAYGLSVVRRRLLHYSWRSMLFYTTVGLNLVDAFFQFFTIFDVVRSQYFYLGESVLVMIPAAANFVVSTFVVVEMAEEGNEGLTYGLLTTISNLGSPFASAISNQIFGLFKPDLSNSANYVLDTPLFRRTVAWSFAVSYFFSFFSMITLVLLPDQKEEAQSRKKNWPKKERYAYMTVAMLLLALGYSLTVNILTMIPSTMCLKFAGGQGCNADSDSHSHLHRPGHGNSTSSASNFSSSSTSDYCAFSTPQ